MDVSVKNLVSRNGKYYFRCRCPAGMRGDDMREIKISLKTSDLKKAVSVCKLITGKLNHLIESGAANTMTLDEIRRILAGYISQDLEEHARQMADYGPICPDTRREGMRRALNAMQYYERDRDAGFPEGRSVAEGILQNIPHTPSDLNFMAQEWTMAQIFLMRMQHDRIAGKRFLTEYNQSIYDEIMSGNYRSADEIRQAETVHTLGELVEQYLAAPHPTWGMSMREAVQNALTTMTEYFGADTDIKSLKLPNLTSFRDNVLMKLPARRKIYPGLRNCSLLEQVEARDGETLSITTVNLMTARIASFFIWCFDNEYIDRSPAAKLKIKTNDAPSEKRSTFTPEDLKTIFTELREDRLNAWKPHKLWIPLIALFSGARQNEICQLQIHNILNVEGIPCFNIIGEPEYNTRLKNVNSKRLVPIHPVLLQLGFLDYVLKRRKNIRGNGSGDKRLWQTLNYSEKYGYGHGYEKSFGNFLRAYVTKDKKKVFHSFRHSFDSYLSNKEPNAFLIQSLDGHGKRGELASRYSKAFLSDMLATLCKLDYGFDIFDVLGKTPLPDEAIQKQIDELPRLTGIITI